MRESEREREREKERESFRSGEIERERARERNCLCVSMCVPWLLKRCASLPIEVVFPPPLTPTNIITYKYHTYIIYTNFK